MRKILINIVQEIFKLILKIKPVKRKLEDILFAEKLEEASNSITIVSPLDTLNKIKETIAKEQQGCYMRFGDGDVFLLNKQADLYQKASEKLSTEMKEAFAMSGSSIYKSLSIHSKAFGYEKEMYLGNHLVSDAYATYLLQTSYPYFIGHQIYSPVALHYAATYHPALANEFLKILKSKTFLFIGNKHIKREVLEKLFGQEIQIVGTPDNNAYTAMDDVEQQASSILANSANFGVVVIAMGCSGRVLMKRLTLLKKNIFLFDFGSLLDGLNGVESRTWLKKEEIDYQLLMKDL
ncbi:MAG: GT-D fold domain-containing glycosyltransferase [Pedobacter sp.]